MWENDEEMWESECVKCGPLHLMIQLISYNCTHRSPPPLRATKRWRWKSRVGTGQGGPMCIEAVPHELVVDITFPWLWRAYACWHGTVRCHECWLRTVRSHACWLGTVRSHVCWHRTVRSQACWLGPVRSQACWLGTVRSHACWHGTGCSSQA